MSAWDMNDGSALTGTHTFTNGSAIVNGNASAVYLTEVKVGDVVTSAAGERLRVKDQHPARVIPTSGVNDTTNVITFTAHGYLDGTAITYNAGGGTAMAGLTDGQIVFVRDKADDTFKVAATSGGTAIDITGTGNNAQNFVGLTNTGLTMTTSMAGSTESGVAASVSRPPIDFSSGGTQIDANILGLTTAEAEAGFDNIVSLAPLTGGTGYGSAPTVTVAAPTVRTIATSAVDVGDDEITLANHGLRTGMKLKYQDGGGTALAGLTDNTDYFVIRVSESVIKLASSLSNANAGTQINLTGTGNNAQTLEGIQATGTAVLTNNKVTSITITEAGTDYQTVPAVTIAAPAEKTFNAASAVAGENITISSHPFATGDQVTYSDKGGTAIAELTDGGTFFIIDADANTVKLASTLNNANAGTAISLSDGPSENHGLTGVTATATAAMGAGDVFTDANASSEVAHVGWVKKTVGTGGRAGRVFYETLVAASSISGDAADDAGAPDS